MNFWSKGRLFFSVTGLDKTRPVLGGHPNANFITEIYPLAQNMMALSERAYRNGDFLDLAYSVPNYLKEFQATTPRKKV